LERVLEKPELISFKLCPFVQRSNVLLLEKGVEFDVRYVDETNDPSWKENKPDWFLKLIAFR
jgi:glutathione S-transferase